MRDVFSDYLARLRTNLASGRATEHTHRAALELLLNGLGQAVQAVNEPKRSECGAPDFVVQRNNLTIGYVEAKDIGHNLAEAHNTEQLKRYRKSLDNLVLTNYLDFRWYVHGEPREAARLGRIDEAGKLQEDKDGVLAVERLLESFLHRAPEPVHSPEELARRMARIADMIRDIIIEAFEKKAATYTLLPLRNAFARTLLPELQLEANTREFADMYAQTLAYGLFAARCNHDLGQGGFRRLGAAAEIPKTNPFLRELFESITGTKMDDEPFAGFVDDLVQLLDNADMESILAQFGKRSGRQDPVVHFYETFLAEYDPKLREVRGVYYTPEEAVSYIVRSIDAVLKKDFALPEGLADISRGVTVHTGHDERTVPKVLILDPACGTGTFLYAVVDSIRERLRASGQGGTWSGYVKDHLLPRLFGFELLMAPYAVAHFKLGMQLAGMDMPREERHRWAYDFASEERLGIYLTNTLDLMERQMEVDLPGIIQTISREGKEAQAIKDDLPIMVILGNPPYSGHSANASWVRKGKGKQLTFIGTLIEDYKQVQGKPLGERNPKWLQDDYVKFIRWAQWRVDKTGCGVVGFITNHGYLDNPTFRGMRASLMNSFSRIYVLDLHGNARKKEKSPDGSPDQNIFDIEQGVAIVFLVKFRAGKKKEKGMAKVMHAEAWGKRKSKYDYLLANDMHSTQWTELSPCSPLYLFTPFDDQAFAEYRDYWKITDVFPVNSIGIATARDNFTISWTADALWQTIQQFITMDPEAARERYQLRNDSKDWRVCLAQKDITKTGLDRKNVTSILYRPFDRRHTYYTGRSGGFHCRPRLDVMQHVLGTQNMGMSTTRSVEVGYGWEHIFCSREIIQLHTVSLKEVNYFFPLYLNQSLLQDKQKSLLHCSHDDIESIPNINMKFLDAMREALGMEFEAKGTGDLESAFGPEAVFYYTYGIFHSPGYRARYADYLKSDFPRIPLTTDTNLFRTLCGLGAELVACHLLESAKLTPSNFLTTYPERARNEEPDTVAKGHPLYDEATTRVHINAEQYFQGVPPEVWAFRVGGYQVAEKWLKDRQGRTLRHEELMTYQKIVLALSETLRLMQAIDAAIPGWPLP